MNELVNDEYDGYTDHQSSFTILPFSSIFLTFSAPKEAINKSIIAFPIGNDPQI